jgi:hypothetical protein
MKNSHTLLEEYKSLYYLVNTFIIPLIPIKIILLKQTNDIYLDDDNDAKQNNVIVYSLRKNKNKHYVIFSFGKIKIIGESEFDIKTSRLFNKIYEHLYTIQKDIISKISIKGVEHNADKDKKTDNEKLKQVAYIKEYIDSIYDKAIEVGISRWLSDNITGSNHKKINFQNILNKFNEWASKLYEGYPITQGFFIDKYQLDNKPNRKATKYLEFLEKESCAPISSIPNSIVKIDSYGNILGYYAIESSYKRALSKMWPIQYSKCSEICDEKSSRIHENMNYFGLFLTENSEIVLFDENQILLVKRNNKWIDYSKDYFIDCFNALDIKISVEKADFLYSTLIDMSFEKKGSCIAIYTEADFIESYNEKNWFDNILLSENEIKEAMKKSKKGYDQKFLESRLEQRKIKRNLINKCKFYDLNRQLILELTAMDGATIMSQSGEIIALGSIVDLNTRGDGGGRTAAAKSLSTYGVAIKVSTDGYIEMYHKQQVKYSLRRIHLQ